MSKKKILHLAKWYPYKENELLGIFVRKQIESIQHEFDNIVITLAKSDSIHSEIERHETQFEEITEVTYYHKKGLISYLIACYKIWKEIKSTNPDLIHTHIMGWTNFLAFLYYKIHNTPFLISEHWSGYRNALFNKQNYFIKKIKNWSAKAAKEVLVVSESLKKDMQNAGIAAKYNVVGNVVEGNPIQLNKNDQFTFIFVGDLEQKLKNVEDIIIAFAEVLKTNNNIHLDIIGDGTDKESYIKLRNDLGLNGNINFHGSKSNKEVFAALSSSHTLILNSYYETFSIICAEALLCGIPVIATKCGGPEYFLNNNTGILVEPNNRKQLSEAMHLMIKTANTYSKDELKQVAKQFSKEIIGEKLREIYTLSSL